MYNLKKRGWLFLLIMGLNNVALTQSNTYKVFMVSDSSLTETKGSSFEPGEIITYDITGKSQIIRMQFDGDHALFQQYKKRQIKKDSFYASMQKFLIDTLNLSKWQKENELLIFLKEKTDGSCIVIPDLNHNGKFNDDSVFLSENPKTDEVKFIYRMPFWFKQRYTSLFTIVIKPNAASLPKKSRLAPLNTWAGTRKVKSGHWVMGVDTFLVSSVLPWRHVYYTKQAVRVSFSNKNENYIDLFETSYPVYSFKDSILIEGRFLMIDTISITGDTIVFKKVGESVALKGVQTGAVLKSVYGTHLSTGVFEDISLKRTDSKYTLLHFWGSWCGPCIANLPKLKVFAYEMNEKVEFISFPYEQQQDTVKTKKLIQQYQLNWKQMIQFRDHPFQKPDMVKQLAIEHFPTYMLIDYTGKILVRSSNLEDVIKALK